MPLPQPGADDDRRTTAGRFLLLHRLWSVRTGLPGVSEGHPGGARAASGPRSAGSQVGDGVAGPDSRHGHGSGIGHGRGRCKEPRAVPKDGPRSAAGERGLTQCTRQRTGISDGGRGSDRISGSQQRVTRYGHGPRTRPPVTDEATSVFRDSASDGGGGRAPVRGVAIRPREKLPADDRPEIPTTAKTTGLGSGAS
jgi:hypothetical protein